MPIYEYCKVEGAEGCELCSSPFEVRQSIHDPKLTKCPQCGGPIARQITPVSVNTYLPRTRSVLSEKNLREKGFAKLVNEGGGQFRRVT